jgi:hypothetical protein
MSKIFTQLPEELFDHPLFKDASVNYKMVLIAVLRYTAFEDQPKANLLKGQCRKSVREIAVEANVSPSTAQHALNHFKGVNGHKKIRRDVASGLRPILAIQSAMQNAGQEKQVYNVLLKGFYEIGDTVGDTVGDMVGDTVAIQSRYSLPRENTDNRQEAKKLDKETTTGPLIHDRKKLVVEAFHSFGIEQKYHDSLISKGLDKVLKALEVMSAPGFAITSTAIQCIRFIIREESWNWNEKKTHVSNRDKILQHFQDGVLYENAICVINSNEISFYRGANDGGMGATFESKAFWPNFANALKRYGIANPFNKIQNIKEA